MPNAVDAPYGMRLDGTPKGKGYFGLLPMTDGSGTVASELSADAEVEGKKLFFPLIVPTLTRAQLDHLLAGKPPTEDIYDKAIAHAQERIRAGMSPFAGRGEQVPVPHDNENEAFYEGFYGDTSHVSRNIK